MHHGRSCPQSASGIIAGPDMRRLADWMFAAEQALSSVDEAEIETGMARIACPQCEARRGQAAIARTGRRQRTEVDPMNDKNTEKSPNSAIG